MSTRRVLDAEDLEHLLRGGAIRIEATDTEFMLMDVGFQTIAEVLAVASGSKPLKRVDLTRVL